MLLAESACPAGRGSTVAGKDNTPLVMLTEGGLLSLWPLLEVLMRSKMAKRQEVFLKPWAWAAQPLDNLRCPALPCPWKRGRNSEVPF